MAFLKRAKKEDLISLAKDLGADPAPTLPKIELVALIQGNKHYNDEDAKLMLETIVTERQLEEEREERKLEEERKEKQTEAERKEREERVKMEFELEKLRLTSNSSPNPRPEKSSIYELTKTVPSFDPRNGDITLFLSLFERQAKRAQIDTKDWVSGLLMLLPFDIVQLIARESEENFDNYNYIKGVLLKRFKLSPEEFRKKFLHHQKGPEKSWREFTFELSNYFQEWVDGLKIDSFEKLRDLIITDQIKRRASVEAKNHFLDDWTKLASPTELADKLDEFELVRYGLAVSYRGGIHHGNADALSRRAMDSV